MVHILICITKKLAFHKYSNGVWCILESIYRYASFLNLVEKLY